MYLQRAWQGEGNGPTACKKALAEEHHRGLKERPPPLGEGRGGGRKGARKEFGTRPHRESETD